jgi:hypothetical protein
MAVSVRSILDTTLNTKNESSSKYAVKQQKEWHKPSSKWKIPAGSEIQGTAAI